MLKPEQSQLQSITVNGTEITYDIHGETNEQVLVLMSGWCQDHRLFAYIVEPLAKKHKVIRINWRGHHYPDRPIADFGVSEQVDDVVAVLDALGVAEFVPVSTAHGGWTNIELCQRVGKKRAPRAVIIDWILTEAGQEFIHNLQTIQDPDRWLEGRENLFAYWLGGGNNRVIYNHLETEMRPFGFDMWARSCRVIENAYKEWGSPLQRMAALDEKRPIIHIYTQSPVPNFEEIEEQFIIEHPWFCYRHIDGKTHFPTLESPEAMATAISEFVSGP